MKKYVIEFVGTFFLVFTVALTGNPLAIAAILVSMIYMGGHISGGHYNPAVTLAVFIRGAINWKDGIMYWIVQMLGGIVAALLFASLSGQKFIPQPHIQATFGMAVLVEALYTFALASVVLHTATSEDTAGNDYYGLAIGFVILAAAFAGGLSGGAYNPAVGVGPLLADYTNMAARMQNLGIYLIGPLSGGLLAGLLYKLINVNVAEAPKKKAK